MLVVKKLIKQRINKTLLHWESGVERIMPNIIKQTIKDNCKTTFHAFSVISVWGSLMN